MQYCKNIRNTYVKTNKYGATILMYDLRYLTFYIEFRRMTYVSMISSQSIWWDGNLKSLTQRLRRFRQRSMTLFIPSSIRIERCRRTQRIGIWLIRRWRTWSATSRSVSILMRSAPVICFFLFIGTPFVVVFLVTYE